MKSEQEKAIYRLKMSINIPLNDGSTTIVNVEDIETALNIIKDMKVQEENYKNLIADVSGIAKELGLEEDGTIDEIYTKIKEKDKEIEKKDKIIDEMAKKLNQAYFDENKFEIWFEKMMGVQEKMDYGYVVPLIKQYFERKEKC